RLLQPPVLQQICEVFPLDFAAWWNRLLQDRAAVARHPPTEIEQQVHVIIGKLGGLPRPRPEGPLLLAAEIKVRQRPTGQELAIDWGGSQKLPLGLRHLSVELLAQRMFDPGSGVGRVQLEGAL